MRSQVIVTFGPVSSYRFDLEEMQPMPHEQARSWLNEQFNALGCEPNRLSGKVLTADKVLGVAQAVGEARFRDAGQRDWALLFARATSAALAKPVVSVDLETRSLHY